MNLTRSFTALLLGGALVCSVRSDVTLGLDKFRYSSGDKFVKGESPCGARWLHVFQSGGDISRSDCPGKTLKGEEVATFPGPSGTYSIRVKFLAKNNKPGTAKWWVKVNGSQVAGGTSLMANSCQGKDVCASKTACSNECISKDVAKASLKTGDKIYFGGTTSWPCGCDGARGGYYTGYAGMTLVGGPSTATIRDETRLSSTLHTSAKRILVSDIRGRVVDGTRTGIHPKRGIYVVTGNPHGLPVVIAQP